MAQRRHAPRRHVQKSSSSADKPHVSADKSAKEVTRAKITMLGRLRKDVENERTFYRKFHQNRLNLYLHAVCVPIEVN